MKNHIHLRLNYSSGIIFEEEIEPEENSTDEGEVEDEDQEEVHIDINNEIIEA